MAARSSEVATKHETAMRLEDDREIVIERTFNGPARIVFDAWTRPELVRRWWAPAALGVTMVSCDADVRVGGTYRYVLKPAGAPEFAFSGTYTEVTPPTRLVYTQIFEPMAGAGEVISTVTFEERGGKTHVVSREVYPSAEVRTTVLETGMEHGMRITMDQLDELVASLS